MCYETLKRSGELRRLRAGGATSIRMYAELPFDARQLSADLELLSSSARLTARVWI